jgi:hypothetical protein
MPITKQQEQILKKEYARVLKKVDLELTEYLQDLLAVCRNHEKDMLSEEFVRSLAEEAVYHKMKLIAGEDMAVIQTNRILNDTK